MRITAGWGQYRQKLRMRLKTRTRELEYDGKQYLRANGVTGHNPAVLEAEGREEVLNKARNVFMGFHIANSVSTGK